jgi:hypothetical protein
VWFTGCQVTPPPFREFHRTFIRLGHCLRIIGAESGKAVTWAFASQRAFQLGLDDFRRPYLTNTCGADVVQRLPDPGQRMGLSEPVRDLGGRRAAPATSGSLVARRNFSSAVRHAPGSWQVPPGSAGRRQKQDTPT